MRKVQAQGSYSIPKEFDNAGADVTFEFEYEIFDTLAEAQQALGGENKVLAMINQTRKEDCRNNASGSAKSDNGHSTRVTLTPEEKERRSQEARATREMIKLAKSKGLTLNDLMALIK
jgi:hypothetical protein